MPAPCVVWSICVLLGILPTLTHAALCSDFAATGERARISGSEPPPDVKEKYVAVWSQDGRRISIREVGSGREVSTLPYGLARSIDKPGGMVYADFVGDARAIVQVPNETALAVHDIATGRLIEKVEGYTKAFSQFGVTVFSGGPRGIRAVDAATGRVLLEVADAKLVHAVGAFAADGRFKGVLATTAPSFDVTGDAIILDAAGRERARWRAGFGQVSHDGRYVASIAPLGSLVSVRIVDFDSGREICADEFKADPDDVPLPVLFWLRPDLVRFWGWSEHRRRSERVEVTVDLATIPPSMARQGGESRSERFSHAFAAFQRGDFAAARREFEEGLVTNPGSAPARFYLGETYLRLKENAAAAREFRRVRALAPDSKEAAQAGERLLQLGLTEGTTGAAASVNPGALDPRHTMQRVANALAVASKVRDTTMKRPYHYVDGTWGWWQLLDSTRRQQELLDLMAAVHPAGGDVLVCLDCGDGATAIYAALRYGLQAVGVSQDEESARISRDAARSLGVTDRVRFVVGDVLAADLAQATVVTLNGRVTSAGDERLLRKLQQLPPRVRIVSRTENGREWKWSPDRIHSGESGHSFGVWLGRGTR